LFVVDILQSRYCTCRLVYILC